MSRELEGNSFPWKMEGAPDGTVRNAPDDDIPSGAISKIVNAHCFPTEFQPRLGTKVYSKVHPPVLKDSNGNLRRNIIAEKNGDTIHTTTSVFSQDDVSNYFVWPGDWHDEITEYLSANSVKVNSSNDRDLTSGCYLRGRLNIHEVHSTQQRRVYQFDKDLYVANLAMDSFDKCSCVSYDMPKNTLSDWDEMDEYGVFSNPNGIFQVNFTPTPRYWKKNTPVPSILPESIIRNSSHKHRYDYTYAMARLSYDQVDGIRDRTTLNVKVLQESGTICLNPNTSPPRDYGIRWTTKKIDDGVKLNGKLTGGVMAAAQQSVDYYNGVAAPGVSFRLQMNNRTENFLIDCSPTGYNCMNMVDVANAFQAVIKGPFPFATCEYHEDGYFIFTSGEQEGSTMGWGTAGTGGTDIAALLLIRNGDGGTLDNSNVYAEPHQVGVFYVPKVSTAPSVPEWHWTHYVKYRTTDIGPNGVTSRVNETSGEELPPLKFHWDGDIRISGAFYGTRTASGFVTAVVGTFEEADEGTPLEWEDGDVDTIVTFVDESHVWVRDAANGEEEYYGDEAKPLQAIAIGGGRVIRASQSGTTITIESEYNDDVFTSSDERKTITWSDGSYAIILEVLSSTTAKLDSNLLKTTQGITFDAINRVINDMTPDSELRDREEDVHIGLLDHRFYLSMPDANILKTVPGFMLSAVRGEKIIHYCHLPVGKKYVSGYYLENRQQLDRIKGKITGILEAPNKFIVLCANQIWAGPTNQIDIKYLPEFGEAYAVLYVDIIEAQIGVRDIGSIQEIETGVFQARMSDNSVRRFTGQGLVKSIPDLTMNNVGQDLIKMDFEKCWQSGASVYNPKLGHILWLREK